MCLVGANSRQSIQCVLLPCLALTLAIFLSTGCPGGGVHAGTGPSGSVQPGVGRPGWIPRPNRKHPQKLFVTGGCRDQATVRAARRCAIADAARQIRQQLGSAVAVHVKGQFVEDEHSERRKASGGIVIDGWVLVAYPRTQLARAEARIANRALLGLACNAATIGACEQDALEAQVLAAMTKAGLQAAPGQRARGAEAADAKLAMKIAEKARAAKLLLAVINTKFLGSEDGEFYASARCDYRLIDAVSGKVLSSNTYGPIKGGHLNKKDALKKAIDNCMKKLLPGVGSATF